MMTDKKHFRTILQSKRANIYYLEHCRLLVNGGRVEFLTSDQEKASYWNIPIANTSVILLGNGTSITQAAMRMLASAGVMLGFCGNGGTPLFASTEIEWLSPQSEYRPTEYVQKWLSFWFDPSMRLQAAQTFQYIRLKNLHTVWDDEVLFQEYEIFYDDQEIERLIARYTEEIEKAESNINLLASEARATKLLYKYIITRLDCAPFSRDHSGPDKINIFLNHGNYLAYGLAATALWVLGIPHGFAVMHGKTRKGALVFDVADLIKDAIVLPTAFICAIRGDREQDFRDTIIDLFIEHNALNIMIESIKSVCSEFGKEIL
jgi:CRISPR-associated protein Cas1